VDILTQALLPTLSLVEALWIGFCMVGLARVIPLTHTWWQDYQYARAHKQEARAKAGLLLMAVGGGVTALLFFNFVGGLLSAMNPPNRVNPTVTQVSVGIVACLILGQVSIVVMLEVVKRLFDHLVGLGITRIHGEAHDRGE
jgi:hypothetical protein